MVWSTALGLCGCCCSNWLLLLQLYACLNIFHCVLHQTHARARRDSVHAREREGKSARERQTDRQTDQSKRQRQSERQIQSERQREGVSNKKNAEDEGQTYITSRLDLEHLKFLRLFNPFQVTQ